MASNGKWLADLLYSLRRFLYSDPPGIRILRYCSIQPSSTDLKDEPCTLTPERFEEHLQLLQSDYEVISLTKAMDRLRSGVDDNEGKPKTVITFDHGLIDYQTHALPLLTVYGLPSTLFITTRFCDQTDSHPHYNHRGAPQHLNWEQLSQLSQHPLVTIGSQSISHANLSNVEEEIASQEIRLSKEIIEERLKHSIGFFSYPDGQYDAAILGIMDRSHYTAAVSTHSGSNSIETPIYELNRTKVYQQDTPQILKKKLTGAYDLVLNHFNNGPKPASRPSEHTESGSQTDPATNDTTPTETAHS